MPHHAPDMTATPLDAAPHAVSTLFNKPMGLIWSVLLAFTLFLPAQAQEAPDPEEELQTTPGNYGLHEKGIERLNQAREISPFSVDTLFGDQINHFDGGVSFAQVDISIPGNDGLPVELRRVLSVDDRSKINGNHFGGFAEWDLDIPHLSSEVALSVGWRPEGGTVNQRCSVPGPLPGTATVAAEDYWGGYKLSIPGQGSQQLLMTPSTSLPAAGGGPWPWITKQMWRIGCKSATANGYGGEAFIALSPEGVEYHFDHVVSRAHSGVNGELNSFPVHREVVYFLVTRIKDRFGNEVTYSYLGDKLQSIQASDHAGASEQRFINLTWTGGRITSASSSVGNWSYGYSGQKLEQVTRPDASQWVYASTGALAVIPPPWNPGFKNPEGCPDSIEEPTGSYVLTITAPSGASAQYTFGMRQHHRSNVPELACYINSPQYWFMKVPRFHWSLTLTSKSITGPGLSPMTWTYAYGQPSPFGGDTKQNTVTGPEEKFTRYTYGTGYRLNEGQLLTVERGASASAILNTSSTTYVSSAEAASQAFPAAVGTDPRLWSDLLTTAWLRPAKQTTTTQQGRQFTWQVGACSGALCFDVFARPTRVTKSSNVSGNPSRTETTSYHDNTAKWILGQVSEVTCVAPTTALPAGCGSAGTVMSQTTFDPAYALPLTESRFGQLVQTLAWNTTASVASGQRGTLHTIKDGRNNTITLTNWKRGVPRTIQYPPTPASPPGATPTPLVKKSGANKSVTGVLGDYTRYSYDDMSRLSGVTYPTGDSTTWAPTTRSFVQVNSAEFGIPAGHWRLTETTGAHARDTYYDGLWRPLLTRERDTGDSATTRYIKRSFDADGRETFASYPSASSTPSTGIWSTHDALGRLTSVAQDSELGLLTTTTEYLTNFGTRTTNPRDFQTTTYYQAFDAPDYSIPTHLAEPGGVSTTISRDAYGKPLTITRSGSYSPPTGGTESLTLSRRFLYDAQQRLCKTIEPDAGIALFTYDAAGNLQWSSTGQNTLTSTTACQTGSVGASQRSVHHYDARNRLIAIDHPAQTDDVGFTYYADGALHTASTGTLSGTAPVTWSAKTSEWTYTLNKRRLLTGESLHLPPENKTFALTRSYTALGHEATLTYPNTAPGTALTVAFTPNALGQARQAGTYATTATYHPNGQIKDFTYGNAITRSLIQNTRGLPERILDQYASTKTLDHTLTYDENANLQSLADGIAGAQESRNLTYDARDRLAGISATPASGTYAETYAYDPLDRIRRITQPGKDWRYSYDASTFRLHEIRNPANVLQRSYQWNTRGEWDARITHTVGNPPIAPPTIFRNGFEQALISTTETFTFDRARRLVNANGITHRYDAHGRRVVTIEPMWGSKHQVYDQAGTLRYLEDSGNNERIDYIHLNGQLIAERSRPLNGTTAIPRYLHSDHRGSPSVKTASNRTVIYRSWHDAYGAPKDGLWRDGPGFTGHQMDPASQLIYMQQRYHDPETGFISTDPVGVNTTTGGNFNRYWYANNNPYRFVDPDGRYIESAWDAASLSVGIVSLGGNVWNGNWSAAAADVGGIALDTAALLIPVVPGGASVAIQASRAGSNIVEAGARGRASEARVLSEMGETKNTAVASTSQGRTIPDFQNATQVGEIKDTARLSDSSQLRAQREHAQATGREHVVVTGANTQVSGTVQNQSTVIRRDDLGPEGKR